MKVFTIIFELLVSLSFVIMLSATANTHKDVRSYWALALTLTVLVAVVSLLRVSRKSKVVVGMTILATGAILNILFIAASESLLGYAFIGYDLLRRLLPREDSIDSQEERFAKRFSFECIAVPLFAILVLLGKDTINLSVSKLPVNFYPPIPSIAVAIGLFAYFVFRFCSLIVRRLIQSEERRIDGSYFLNTVALAVSLCAVGGIVAWIYELLKVKDVTLPIKKSPGMGQSEFIPKPIKHQKNSLPMCIHLSWCGLDSLSSSSSPP